MNLVQRQIFGNKSAITYNTYIGGVSASIPNASSLATKLGISVGAISNFTIVGSDIKCKITGSYSLSTYFHLGVNSETTYYDDNDGLVYQNGYVRYYPNTFRIYTPNLVSFSSAYYGRECPLLKLAYFPYITSINNSQFYESNCDIFYIPRAATLGPTTGYDGVFLGLFLNDSVSKTIYCHPSLATNNGGAPDGDIAYAISIGAIILYVTNFTVPNPISNLSAGTIYSTAIQLNFTPPSSTNTIDYYEVWLNGFPTNKIITANGQYITGLTASTSYVITLVAVDVFYNKSIVSNNITTTTNTTSVVPLSGLVSYYKLDSNSNDSYGSNNGTDTSISYVSGKVNNSASLNGSSSLIVINDSNSLSFGNGTTDTAFSFSFWLKLNSSSNQVIINKLGGSTSTDEYFIAYWGGKLSISLKSSGNNALSIDCNMVNSLTIGIYNYITITYDGSSNQNGIKIYLNSVSQSCTKSMAGTYIAMGDKTAPVRIGRAGWTSTGFLNGFLDEIAIHNAELNQAQIDLLYNSGTGTTL